MKITDTLDRFAVALTGVIVCFVLLSVFRGCWEKPVGQSPVTVASGQVLADLRKRDAAVQDSLQRLIAVQAEALHRAQVRAERAVQVADSLRRTHAPPPPDTDPGAVAYWKKRLAQSEAANDELRAGIVSLRERGELAAAATAQLHAKELQSKDDLLAAANAHITNLTADVERLSGRCWYVKPLVPCLPRKAEVVGAVALGAYAGWRLSR